MHEPLIHYKTVVVTVTHIYESSMKTIGSDANAMSVFHIFAKGDDKISTRIENLYWIGSTVCHKAVSIFINIHILGLTQFPSAILTNILSTWTVHLDVA